MLLTRVLYSRIDDNQRAVVLPPRRSPQGGDITLVHSSAQGTTFEAVLPTRS